MTETKQADEALSVTDPKAVAEREGRSVSQETNIHEDREQYNDHCESDVVGRAIVGVTDTDDRLLLLVASEREAAILPHETVAPGEDWAAVGRECVEEFAGIDVTLEGLKRVRAMDHVIEDEETVERTVYHVVFSGSVASAKPLDSLCADNPFELGWYDELPSVAGNQSPESVADIQIFLD